MNTYRYVFAAICPNDGDSIIYGLEIRSQERIMVEAIKDACAEWPTGFQEDIAADLHKQLGGVLTLRAQHQSVEIVTTLGAPGPITECIACSASMTATPMQIPKEGMDL